MLEESILSFYINIVGLFVFLVVIMVFVQLVFKPRRSKHYRRTMSDMYIAGRIKQIASENNIDLAEEFEDFKLFIKKGRINNQELDETIEEQLQEEIGESMVKKKEKPNKK